MILIGDYELLYYRFRYFIYTVWGSSKDSY